MPVDPSVIEEQLRALGEIDTFGTKKEVKCLPDILVEGEVIKGVASGMMDANTWLCVVTEQRILLLDKGMIFGLKQIEFPIKQIKSISHKSGLLMGELLIDTAGQIKKLDNMMKKDAVKLAAVISSLLHGQGSVPAAQPAPAAPAPAADDVVSQLERLAALKEKGILTDEEFAQQKAKILGR